jgi:hypothetical protein
LIGDYNRVNVYQLSLVVHITQRRSVGGRSAS